MISRGELIEILNRSNTWPIATVLLDNFYAEPEPESIDEFWVSYGHNLEALKIAKFRAEVMDCDKFSRIAWGLFSIDYIRTRFLADGSLPDCGIAFGIFNYFKGGQTSHSINLAVVARKLRFYEPQLRAEVTLTPGEINSCYGLII